MISAQVTTLSTISALVTTLDTTTANTTSDNSAMQSSLLKYLWMYGLWITLALPTPLQSYCDCVVDHHLLIGRLLTAFLVQIFIVKLIATCDPFTFK